MKAVRSLLYRPATGVSKLIPWHNHSLSDPVWVVFRSTTDRLGHLVQLKTFLQAIIR